MTTQSDPAIARELHDAEVYDGDWEIRLVDWVHGGGLERLLNLIPDRARIREGLEYMSDVFMPEKPFREIVDEGPGGDETYTMNGDDLGGFCWHFDDLLKLFGIGRDIVARFAERPYEKDGVV